MRYENWLPLFEQIKKDISLSWNQDEEAAIVLNSLLNGKPKRIEFFDIKQILNGKKVIIFGAGPSLIKGLHKYQELQRRCVVISADGATSALVENGIIPDIIITDLDGRISDQLEANRQGSILVTHAHGDNIKTLKETFPKIAGSITGSIQINPKDFISVFNVGGFTDGDRAVFLATHCLAKKIYLVGFDFTGEIGEYSFPEQKNKGMKLKKLYWCSYLINQLQTNHDIEFLRA